jgi:ABC-2 type transport system permease protein
MNKRLRVLRAFVKKEIFQILRDPRMRMILFVAPMAQLTLFGVAISNETRNVRLAIYAKPQDVIMRDFYNRAIGTKWFIPANTAGSDPFEWVKSGEADAVVIAPGQGLSHSVQKGGTLQILINAQNSNRALAIESYLKIIANQSFKTAQANVWPLHFDIRALYNPTFETSHFMVPGVLSMLVCLVTILLTSMAVAREKEVGTIETLTSAPLDSWDLLLGKTVPFIILGSLQTPLILGFAVLVFGLPMRGPLLMLIVATLLMIMSTVSIGLLISTISRNQQQAMLGGFMYLFPSYLLSGLMFPIENMPFYFKPFAYVNPLTHYMGLLRNILLIGGDTQYFIFHTLVLTIITLIIGAFALKRFKAMV